MIADAQRAHLCSLIRVYGVLSQEFHTNVNNKQSKAGACHPYIRPVEHLNNNPRYRQPQTETSDDNSSASPVVRRKPTLPIQTSRAPHVVRAVAHLAPQVIAARRQTLHQPPAQAFVMHAGDISRAVARLNQRLLLLRFITDPTLSAILINERIRLRRAALRLREDIALLCFELRQQLLRI